MPLAVIFIQWGIDDTVLGVSLVHTALALPSSILTTASIFAGVSVELEEAAMTLGCTAPVGVRDGSSLPARAARPRGVGDLRLHRALLERGLRRVAPHAPPQDAARGGSRAARRRAAEFRFAGGFFLMAPSVIVILLIRRYLFSMWGRVLK